MKPNFKEMSRKELKDYILKHRDDDEAFSVYMDKLNAEPNKTWFPAPKSIEDLAHFPKLLEERLRQRQTEES
ncbi:MAG: hypothetical protein WBB28_02900 [Crinalium sp.]